MTRSFSQKPKIVLASVLKPIDDTRMYEKFAHSLCEHFEVHIVGYAAKAPEQASDSIHFHPLYQFNRGARDRLFAGSTLLKLLKKIKPQVVCVHAVELLPAACIYKAKSGAKLWYDIRENYAKNFWHQQVYPSYLRPFLALGVRIVELGFSPFVDKYFLAEKSYYHELGFAKKKGVILENKAKIDPTLIREGFPRTLDHSPLKLVYTGTISELYGIRRAVRWSEKLSELAPISLTIVGYTNSPELRQWLRDKASKHPWITLVGIDELVPHQKLLAILAQQDLALLPYLHNLSTKDCMPTKLYECLALGIPMLLPNNRLWLERAWESEGGYAVDFDSAPTPFMAQDLLEQKFYPNGPDKDSVWEGGVVL